MSLSPAPTPKGKEVKIYLLNGEVSINLWKDFNDSGKNVLTTEFYFVSGNIPKTLFNAFVLFAALFLLDLVGITKTK